MYTQNSAAMSRMSKAILAALTSLANGTAAVRRLLSRLLVRLCSLEAAEEAKSLSLSTSTTSLASSSLPHKTLDQLGDEIKALISHGSDEAVLLKLSSDLQAQFRAALDDNLHCMLPSYNHQLPDGHEKGRYLALDVGGSTFRVALVELLAHGPDSKASIVTQKTYRITKQVKQLQGTAFFDWMAARIDESISSSLSPADKNGLSMGLAWSFPIEQTSLRSGRLQGMGKGFLAANSLLGHDLGDVLEAACRRRKLQLRVSAIVNDGTATLLANAHASPSTRFGLILGTGVNVAVHLPTAALSASKFGVRPREWLDAARAVLVNTELGMFGSGILPLTRWDEQLDIAHERPGFQPLEHLVGGRYLGEVIRLVLVEAARDAGLFDGVVPPSLQTPYSLDTEVLSKMEGASSIEEARCIFESSHPDSMPLSAGETAFITDVARGVSTRASAIIAVSLHALWRLRSDASTLPAEEGVLTVGCNGSVIQSYPGFREKCQLHLDSLVEASGVARGALVLEMAVESSLVGAAVAVACL